MGTLVGIVAFIGFTWGFFWLLAKLQKKVREINKRLPGWHWEISGGNAGREVAEMGEKAADMAEAIEHAQEFHGPH